MEDIIRFTLPLIVSPNDHLHAKVDIIFHKPLLHHVFYAFGFGSFGFGMPSLIYPTANILQLLPSTSGDSDTVEIPPNHATVRLDDIKLHSPYWTVSQVITEHSVLDGIAQLGGMWTAAEGIFALIFGGSLLYFLVGMKPLSRFGLVHLFRSTQTRQRVHDDYPLYAIEGGQGTEPNAGMIAFLREHFVNSLDDEQSLSMATKSQCQRRMTKSTSGSARSGKPDLERMLTESTIVAPHSSGSVDPAKNDV